MIDQNTIDQKSNSKKREALLKLLIYFPMILQIICISFAKKTP